ncbi:MAG TPA: DMT family transporter [Aestuariivirgaceae bacterium]|nr:DMT family transporter [Aestuariivirgaceae bacterium]
MGPAEWAMVGALSLIWGSSYLFNAIALRGFAPLTLVALRLSLGAIALWLIAGAMRYPFPRDPRLWLRFLAMGILNNAIPFTLIVWSQQHIAAGLASVLNATTPLFTVLVAHAFLHDEKLSYGRLAGVTVGMAGVAVMVGSDALAGLDLTVGAQLAALAASLSYAFAGVFGRRFSATSPMTTAAGQVTVSGFLLMPLALAIETPWLSPPPPPEAWAAVAGLAVLCTAFAYILYFTVLRRAGATNILLVTFLIPPSAIALGILFLGEHLSLAELIGLLAIGLGLAMIDGRLLRPQS